MKSLNQIAKAVTDCHACPRLIEYCASVALIKKKQFREDPYWGKPVPGFGDPRAQLLIVGLAPAAHGGNRTGRMFTGDNSGLWLYRALFRAGFSNQEQSRSRNDGLVLSGAYITAVGRCAPPANQLQPLEIENCSRFLRAELEVLTEVKVILALGQVALRGVWRLIPAELKPSPSLPAFKHGANVTLKDGRVLWCSYHPSQQNTFTKKLTEPMFDLIFSEVRSHLAKSD